MAAHRGASREHDVADRAIAPILLAAAEVLCKKWYPAILWYLRTGPKRFNGLHAHLPQVTHKMLVQHLRELERAGVVGRRVVPGRVKHVEYSLTPSGRELVPILELMRTWGIAHRTHTAADVEQPVGGGRHTELASPPATPRQPPQAPSGDVLPAPGWVADTPHQGGPSGR